VLRRVDHFCRHEHILTIVKCSCAIDGKPCVILELRIIYLNRRKSITTPSDLSVSTQICNALRWKNTGALSLMKPHSALILMMGGRPFLISCTGFSMRTVFALDPTYFAHHLHRNSQFWEFSETCQNPTSKRRILAQKHFNAVRFSGLQGINVVNSSCNKLSYCHQADLRDLLHLEG